MTTPYPELRRIFLRARELDPSERADFVREACAGDAELEGSVLDLLGEDRRPTIRLDETDGFADFCSGRHSELSSFGTTRSD